MGLKEFVTRCANAAGYSIIRQDTLVRLLADAETTKALEEDRAKKSAEIEAIVQPEPQPEHAPEPLPPAEPEVAAQPPLPEPALSSPEPAPVVSRITPTENRPSRRCTDMAGEFNPAGKPEWVVKAVGEFRDKGITILKTDPQQATRWRESMSFEGDVANHHSAWDWAGNAIKPYGKFLRTALPPEKMREELRLLLTGEGYEDFFIGVLGCPVTVANCRPVQSLVNKSDGIGPQSWHEDGCPPGVIRGVFYLTDVGPDTGPFQYIGADGGENTVLGSTGDLLIFDAMRLKHRAMPPQDKVRMALDLVFLPRLPSDALEVHWSGMNHWPSDPYAFAVPSDKRQFRTAAE